ncbi:MAG: hypothetical protein K8T89_21990, partial [Planctomycetes bacterium]|nr:hypothetical protein [Planctomycetota bacterium]
MVEYALYVRRYAPFLSFGGGFDGDGRGFSTSLTVTSRTVGVATFGPNPGAKISGVGHSSGSSWVGPWELRKSFPLGSIGRHVSEVRVTVSNVDSGSGKIAFTLYTEGNLPFKDILLHKKVADVVDKIGKAVRPNAPRPQLTPDIDTFVDFSATFGGNRIVFTGLVRGDGFPNAEVFVLDATSNPVPLFDYRTRSNEAGPLHRLFGAHAQNRLGTFTRQIDLNPDGSFKLTAVQSPVVVQEI